MRILKVSREIFLLFIISVPFCSWAQSLGSLDPFEARIPVWTDDSWADAIDTEAKLVAQGWRVVNVPAMNCDDNPGTDEDNSALNTTIQSNCPGGDCQRTIFKLSGVAGDPCVYNITANNGGVLATYHRFAIVGGGYQNSKISCDDTVTTFDQRLSGFSCLTIGLGSWGQGSLGSAFTGSGGFTKGSTSVQLASCSGLTAPVAVKLQGLDEAGLPVSFHTRLTSINGACVATIRDRLPMNFSGALSLIPWLNLRQTAILLDFDIGWKRAPRGACSGNATCYDSAVIFAHGQEDLLLQGMRVGPYVNSAISIRNGVRMVVRNSIAEESLTSARRGTQTGFVGLGGTNFGQVVFVNNIIKRGSPRITNAEGNTHYNIAAFNYQEDQAAFSPDTGSYCGHIVPGPGTMPQGPEGRLANERGIFFHDNLVLGANNMSGFLVEGNDIACGMVTDAGAPYGRYTTLYRNRVYRLEGSEGSSGRIQREGGTTHQWPYLNVWANRARHLGFGGVGYANSLGRWNTFEVNMSVPTDASADWGSTNEIDTAPSDANPACPGLTLPSSLLYRRSTPPSWWCQEACPWNGLALGACDDRTTATCQLPAERRARGLSCTPIGGDSTAPAPPTGLRIN